VHEHFGAGVVISCEIVPGDQHITVAFDSKGVKKLMLSFAPMAAASAVDGTLEAQLDDPTGAS
jgi:hypothetical protein